MTKEEAVEELEEYLQDADKAFSEDEEYIRGWKSAFLIALEITNEIDGKSATPDKQKEIKQETTFTSKSGKYAPDPREMTNQEASEMIRNDMKIHHDYLSGQYRKALNMAIDALLKEQKQKNTLGFADIIEKEE